MRICSHCRQCLADEDLLPTESHRMEEARVSVGLDGLCFRYYTCPRCGYDHIFLEIVPLPGETPRDVHGRKEEVAHAVRGVSAIRTAVLVVEHSLRQVVVPDLSGS